MFLFYLGRKYLFIDLFKRQSYQEGRRENDQAFIRWFTPLMASVIRTLSARIEEVGTTGGAGVLVLWLGRQQPNLAATVISITS